MKNTQPSASIPRAIYKATEREEARCYHNALSMGMPDELARRYAALSAEAEHLERTDAAYGAHRARYREITATLRALEERARFATQQNKQSAPIKHAPEERTRQERTRHENAPVQACYEAIRARAGQAVVVHYVKRTTGETRPMACLYNAEAADDAAFGYNVVEKDLLPVWDLEKGAVRMVALDAVDRVMHQGAQVWPDPYHVPTRAEQARHRTAVEALLTYDPESAACLEQPRTAGAPGEPARSAAA